MKEPCPCKRCKAIPKVVEISGLFYVQCTGTCKKRVNEKNLSEEDKAKKEPRYITVKCDKWGAFEFLGSSRRAAIEAWNDVNSKRVLEEEDII